MVPFIASKLALPSSPPTCDLLSHLPPHIAAHYSDINNLLLEPVPVLSTSSSLVVSSSISSSISVPVPPTSPPLPSSSPTPTTFPSDPHSSSLHGTQLPAEEYRKAIQRMMSVDMIGFTTTPKAINRLFAVHKSEDSSRLILDARAANRLMVPSPHVSLPSPTLFTRLGSKDPFYVGKLDISNFFYALKTPSSWWDLFALPPIRAADLGLDPSLYPPDSMIYPCLKVLPMGFSHSCYLAQAVHEHILTKSPLEAPALSPDMISLLTDLIHSLYLDDLTLISRYEKLINEAIAKLTAFYETIGLSVKASKTVLASESAEILGFLVDGKEQTVSLSPDKLIRLCRATYHILDSRRPVSGRVMSVLVGHWTWCFLVRRPAFAVFSAVYRFVEAAADRPRMLWHSVRQELHAATCLAPLLMSSMKDSWFEKVVATDASSVGAGVVAKSVPVDLTREAAASSSVVGHHVQLGEDQQLATSLSSSMSKILDTPWKTIISSPWKYQDHINLLELESVVLAVRWILSHPTSTGKRVLLLSDSSVTVGSVSKGRSSSHRLLRKLRKLSAYVLASGLQLYCHWIPTDINPADGPSRLRF